eukprot:746660-Hanusia_phi.AAC.4
MSRSYTADPNPPTLPSSSPIGSQVDGDRIPARLNLSRRILLQDTQSVRSDHSARLKRQTEPCKDS